jgi:hypothetical protein
MKTQGTASLSRTRSAPLQLSQGEIVLGIAVLLFVVFAVTLRGFLAPDNLLALVQNVSILGILGLGMAVAQADPRRRRSREPKPAAHPQGGARRLCGRPRRSPLCS